MVMSHGELFEWAEGEKKLFLNDFHRGVRDLGIYPTSLYKSVKHSRQVSDSTGCVLYC